MFSLGSKVQNNMTKFEKRWRETKQNELKETNHFGQTTLVIALTWKLKQGL